MRNFFALASGTEVWCLATLALDAACVIRGVFAKVDGFFSDMLLHDMGADLADPVEPNPDVELVQRNFTGYSGTGTIFIEEARIDPTLPQQWRTPPLWGVPIQPPTCTTAGPIRSPTQSSNMAVRRLARLAFPYAAKPRSNQPPRVSRYTAGTTTAARGLIAVGQINIASLCRGDEGSLSRR